MRLPMSFDAATAPRWLASSAKAEKFNYLQLRSVLDDPVTGSGAGADETWGRLLASPHLRAHAEPAVAVALPSAAEAEAALLNAVEWLAEAVASEAGLRGLYRRFGWGSAEEYFQALGETQVMLVDIDHNDIDDRLAVVLLAHQMASANAERRLSAPAAACTLYLDGRTYETKSGLTIWRTLRLAARLSGDLGAAHGLLVRPVFTDGARALELAAAYLGVPASPEALDQRAAGAGAALLGALRPTFGEPWPVGARVALWLLSGLCALQVKDIEDGYRSASVHFVVFEQAQPAWQSVPVARGAECQPAWDFPPVSMGAAEQGFGVEPSNVRSGEAEYPDILDAYMSLQQAVASAPSNFTYVCPALAREDGCLPAPPGQQMRLIAGRPLTVLPGAEYVVKRALDAPRAAAAFARLLAAAREHRPQTLHAELAQGALDDAGRERREVAHIVKYGTFMADAILVALAARPAAMLEAAAVVRRLAVVEVPEPPEGAQPPPLTAEVSEAQVVPARGCLTVCMLK